MSMKMEHLVTVVKGANSNKMIMTNFTKVADLLKASSQPNLQDMAENLESFERAIDELTINSRVLDGILNKNNDSDANANLMMAKLKNELALEVLFFLI